MILVLVTGTRLLPESRNERGGPVDPLSAALSVGAIVPLVYAIMAWRYVPAGDPDPADPPVHGTMGP